MQSPRFAYAWRYTVDPTRRSDFLAAYKPDGKWAELFSRDPSYIKTMFLQDVENQNRFVTVDYWKSKADRDSFKARYRAEFDSLDSKCEEFTIAEDFLGDYVEFSEPVTD